MLYIKDIHDSFDAMFAAFGKPDLYKYHPKGEENDADVLRFLDYMDTEIQQVLPHTYQDLKKHKPDNFAGRKAKTVQIARDFMELELGRNLTGQEISAMARATHVPTGVNNWLTDHDWDRWLNKVSVPPEDGQQFYEHVT